MNTLAFHAVCEPHELDDSHRKGGNRRNAVRVNAEMVTGNFYSMRTLANSKHIDKLPILFGK